MPLVSTVKSIFFVNANDISLVAPSMKSLFKKRDVGFYVCVLVKTQ